MAVIVYFNSKGNCIKVYYLNLSIQTLKNKKLNNTREVLSSFEHSRLFQISFTKRFLLQLLNIFIVKKSICCDI